MCFTLHFCGSELSFFLVHMLALLLHPTSSSEDILILPLYCSQCSYNDADKLLEQTQVWSSCLWILVFLFCQFAYYFSCPHCSLPHLPWTLIYFATTTPCAPPPQQRFLVE